MSINTHITTAAQIQEITYLPLELFSGRSQFLQHGLCIISLTGEESQHVGANTATKDFRCRLQVQKICISHKVSCDLVM